MRSALWINYSRHKKPRRTLHELAVVEIVSNLLRVSLFFRLPPNDFEKSGSWRRKVLPDASLSFRRSTIFMEELDVWN
jgi:hypothetical protein